MQYCFVARDTWNTILSLLWVALVMLRLKAHLFFIDSLCVLVNKGIGRLKMLNLYLG